MMVKTYTTCAPLYSVLELTSRNVRSVGIDYEGFVKVVCVFGTMNKDQILKLCYSLYDPEQVPRKQAVEYCSLSHWSTESILSPMRMSERRNLEKTVS